MNRIDKIRRLAEEGATEGERRAAREALRRINTTVKGVPTVDDRIQELLNDPSALLRLWQECLIQGRLED